MNGNSGRLQEVIGLVLRAGVIASTTCLAIGLTLSMFGPTAGWAPRLLAWGLILLLATPVGRVAVSVGEFALERDWPFVALTTIVLLELVASVVAALK